MDKQPGQIVTVFRSRLRDDAAGYHDHAVRMSALAREMPGYVEHKAFTADDGERVTVVTFADQASHDAWRLHAEHREAQRTGIADYYETYSIQVATVSYVHDFTRQREAVPPDTKDWTFVVTDGCQECSFRPQDPTTTGQRLRGTVTPWQQRLAARDAGQRPAPTVWSPLEYACHVRDVCRVFRRRLAQILDEDDPTFANWDQDAAALEGGYADQEPRTVAEEYAQEAEATAAAFEDVRDDQWQRAGRRSNGSVFTAVTLAVYFLHDIEHHLHDVGSPVAPSGPA